MKVFKIKQVRKSLGLSKKETKTILMRCGAITASWAVKSAKGLVVELIDPKRHHIETTLFITEAGAALLEEIVHAREWEVSHG